MDHPVSPELSKRRQYRRWMIAACGIVLLSLTTLALSRLQPGGPAVDKSTLFIDTVRRGEMLREVRGTGTLVPEDIRWLPTLNAGRVERILVLPGVRVTAGTALVELSNPDVEQAAFDAEWGLKVAEADLADLRVKLNTDKLQRRKTVATAEADYSDAKLQQDVQEALAAKGITSAVELKQARTKADELAKLLDIEKECLAADADSATAQIKAQEAKVSQLKAQLEVKQRQVRDLTIRAGMDGVLQRLGDPANPLQLGQQLVAGTPVAQVANPARLKATIKVAETQARDVQLDQRAQIDTRMGIVPGHVVRVDPAVDNGTVTVDVALDAPLPRGARPDLTVSADIQIERLNEVVYVGLPVQAQADTEAELFRVVDNGRAAVRVPVKLGRSSVATVEVVSGLSVGDTVILSDMSQYDSVDRLRLE